MYVKAQQQQQQQPGLRVVGYYQANERMADADLGAAGRRIADRVEALGAAAAVAASSGSGSLGGAGGSSVALVVRDGQAEAHSGLQGGLCGHEQWTWLDVNASTCLPDFLPDGQCSSGRGN